MTVQPRGISISWQIFTLVVGMALVAGLVSGLTLYRDFAGRVGGRIEAALTADLGMAAAAAAEGLDGDVLRSVYESRSVDAAGYGELQAALRGVQKEHGLTTDVYTLHLDGNTTRFGVTAKPDPLLGRPYRLTDEMRPVFRGALSGHTGVYRDENGWWISAYAPVRDREGHVVALVEADHELTPYIEDVRGRLVRGLLISFGLGLGIAVPISLSLSRRIVRPLRRLTEAAERISQGDVENVQLNLKAGGEVGRLAESFERAIVSIRYYVDRVHSLESSEGTGGNPPSRDGGA